MNTLEELINKRKDEIHKERKKTKTQMAYISVISFLAFIISLTSIVCFGWGLLPIILGSSSVVMLFVLLVLGMSLSAYDRYGDYDILKKAIRTKYGEMNHSIFDKFIQDHPEIIEHYNDITFRY